MGTGVPMVGVAGVPEDGAGIAADSASGAVGSGVVVVGFAVGVGTTIVIFTMILQFLTRLHSTFCTLVAPPAVVAVVCW
ncbi:hypothetical protein ACQP1K_28080 [Sphaerimonospora sp. CA-214678]|uniref:hypothetical protein n=1 Tax=Sphaerimonospora sp. CA-214678 TaxID=3240029 RepID=UPI003D8C277D